METEEIDEQKQWTKIIQNSKFRTWKKHLSNRENQQSTEYIKTKKSEFITVTLSIDVASKAKWQIYPEKKEKRFTHPADVSDTRTGDKMHVLYRSQLGSLIDFWLCTYDHEHLQNNQFDIELQINILIVSILVWMASGNANDETMSSRKMGWFYELHGQLKVDWWQSTVSHPSMFRCRDSV